jgi:hypothetical protein
MQQDESRTRAASAPVSTPGKRTSSGLTRALIQIVVLGALVLLTWKLADVLLLLFGAVIVAVALRAAAQPLQEHVRLSARLAVATAVIAGPRAHQLRSRFPIRQSTQRQGDGFWPRW